MNDSKRYSGYHQTPLLWEGELYGLTQLDLPVLNESSYTFKQEKNLRLGHLVEYFVEHELSNNPEIEVLARNLQIEGDQRTMGEFDFIINNKGQLQHIEVVFKFYLRDKSISDDPIKQWIGPNRNDSLIKKLNKIRSSQFPLIQSKEAIDRLKLLGIEATQVAQKVFFKGELYTAVDDVEELDPLNQDAFAGHYYTLEQLAAFHLSKFYIPTKHDWLVKPHKNVNWLSYLEADQIFKENTLNKRSSMFWMKDPKGNVDKGFLVCW